MAKVMLVGVELADNLSLRSLSPMLRKQGHSVKLVSFFSREALQDVVEAVAAFQPDLIGLSLIFNRRAREFCDLAKAVRLAGYEGHITAGGSFAHFNARPLLADCPELDSVVYGEGEYAIAELAGGLDHPERVAGLCLRQAGSVIDTAPRAPILDLDSLPFPDHELPPRSYLGVRESNLLSGRGCYARCHFCSIGAWTRDAGLPPLRRRSTSNVAGEVASLYYEHGVRIFYFMDDTFLTPDAPRNLGRLRELDAEFRRRGVQNVGLTVKCRPDDVDPAVFALLSEMGLIRVFTGIESFSDRALQYLGRRLKAESNIAALEILRRLDVHTTYNLLLFNPDSTLSEITENLKWVAHFSEIPFNFCRTEVYPGTPLAAQLRESGRLQGDYWQYRYSFSDPGVDSLFRVCAEAFHGRNWGVRPVNELAMQLDYGLRVLRRFHRRATPTRLGDDVSNFVRHLNSSTVLQLRDAVDSIGASGRGLERFARELSRRVAAEDRRFWREGQRLWSEMERLAAISERASVSAQPAPKQTGRWYDPWGWAREAVRACLEVVPVREGGTGAIVYLSDQAPDWKGSGGGFWGGSSGSPFCTSCFGPRSEISFAQREKAFQRFYFVPSPETRLQPRSGVERMVRKSWLRLHTHELCEVCWNRAYSEALYKEEPFDLKPAEQDLAAAKAALAQFGFGDQAPVAPPPPPPPVASADECLQKAKTYSQVQDWERARTAATDAIRLRPDLIEAYMVRGLAARPIGDLDAAIADYDKVVELDPQNGEAWMFRGASKFQKASMQEDDARWREQLAAAHPDYQRAAELMPENEQAGLALLELEVCSGRYREAVGTTGVWWDRLRDSGNKLVCAWLGAIALILAGRPESKWSRFREYLESSTTRLSPTQWSVAEMNRAVTAVAADNSCEPERFEQVKTVHELFLKRFGDGGPAIRK